MNERDQKITTTRECTRERSLLASLLYLFLSPSPHLLSRRAESARACIRNAPQHFLPSSSSFSSQCREVGFVSEASELFLTVAPARATRKVGDSVHRELKFLTFFHTKLSFRPRLRCSPPRAQNVTVSPFFFFISHSLAFLFLSSPLFSFFFSLFYVLLQFCYSMEMPHSLFVLHPTCYPQDFGYSGSDFRAGLNFCSCLVTPFDQTHPREFCLFFLFREFHASSNNPVVNLKAELRTRVVSLFFFILLRSLSLSLSFRLD